VQHLKRRPSAAGSKLGRELSKIRGAKASSSFVAPALRPPSTPPDRAPVPLWLQEVTSELPSSSSDPAIFSSSSLSDEPLPNETSSEDEDIFQWRAPTPNREHIAFGTARQVADVEPFHSPCAPNREAADSFDPTTHAQYVYAKPWQQGSPPFNADPLDHFIFRDPQAPSLAHRTLDRAFEGEVRNAIRELKITGWPDGGGGI
jgi:hypothetical protein